MAGEHKRWYRVQAIGHISRTDCAGPDEFLDPAKPSTIRIDPRWEAGLTGIEEYSHLVVLFYLDRAQRRRSAGDLMRPEGREEMPPVGFFATRTPRRPNPIGIGCPQLLGRDGCDVQVTGLDAWDGTPVLDIKGYSPRDELRPGALVPEWLTRLWELQDAERNPWPARGPAPGREIARRQTRKDEVVLRYPVPTDAPAALDFINTLSREETFVLYQGAQLTLQQERAWLDGRLASLRAGTSVTVFAFAGDELIGTTEIALLSNAQAHVGGLGISVAANWRGAGIGRFMMETVLAEAERYLLGLSVIQLDVFATNQQAIHLYRSMGFTEHGRFPGAVIHRGKYVDLIAMHRPIGKR
jgi:tRNA-Thr(GGU) m(6)t(6)A37 methyltransferase TsaA